MSILDSIIGNLTTISDNAKEIRSFFSSSNTRTGPRALNLSENIQKYIKKIDEYVLAIHLLAAPESEYFKKLEEGVEVNNTSEKKWVFECFNEIFENYKPSLARSIYRGLRFTNAKKVSNFYLPEKKDEYEKFIRNYEDIQGAGRHTLNSLLADYMDKTKSEWFLFEIQISSNTELSKNEKLISLNISQETIDILINSIDYDVIKNIMELTNEKKSEISKFLEEKRDYAFLSAGKCGSNKSISQLLKRFTDIFNFNNVIRESDKDIFIEILKALQGICIFLKYFEGSLVCLLSREEHEDSEYSCVGEFFILGIKSNGVNEVREFCKCNFIIVDAIQRYYFRKVLHQFKSNPEEYKSLECSLQSPSIAKIITEPIKNKVFNFDSLAGVIRLAEIIRPSAVHEGKPQNFTFIVGFPYILEDRLEKISNFSNEPIEWFTPKKRLKVELEDEELIENEELHWARARIIGNSQIFQEKDVALFVDCIKNKPLCNYIVRPHPHGLSYYKSNIIEIMSEVDDAFIVRILGQKKIEIFHKGKKILVWSHVNVIWEKESTWDIKSLNKFICDKLKVKDDFKKVVNTLAKVIYQISQKQGLGASFVIYEDIPNNLETQCPRMTIPFPELGEGKIAENENVLMDAAIQDGGTLINLTSNKFSARRQWLPHTDRGTPFWHENFPIPDSSWDSDIKNNKEWQDSSRHAKHIDVMGDNSKLLYTMCRHPYLKKQENGLERWLNNPFRWDGWYKILSWGTRHMTSLGMSACLWDKAVVVVVSADSTITVFYQGIEGTP